MIVITGGGSGIGRALALSLAARAETVCVVGRREGLLAEVAAQKPHNISYVCADVSTTDGRQRIQEYLEPYGQIKALVHNAGLIEPIMPLSAIKEIDWQKIMTVNVNAPLFLTQRLLDKLQNGRVIHIGSGVAYFPVTGWGGYCVSKAALAMLTRCCQLEFEDIAFASVMPGIVDTEMQATIRQAEHMSAEKRHYFQQLKDTQQLLTPETIAAFISWLLLATDRQLFCSQEWDVYDHTHHAHWLQPPLCIPHE